MQNVKYKSSFVTGYIKNIKRRHSRTKKNLIHFCFCLYISLSTLVQPQDPEPGQ